MELIVLLFVSSLLRSCEAQGSSDVTPVFVKKGEDVLLNVMKATGPEEVGFVSWKFNKEGILIFPPGGKPTVSPNYTGRIEFSQTNYSMKLKNLQKTDSGPYIAVVFRGVTPETTEHIVTVQDRVSSVKLSVDSVSNSSDSCNFTVTCRTQDSHINSTVRCVNQTCSQDGGEQSKVTTSGASLKAYLANDSIICNHSNQVSQTEDINIIEHLCPSYDDPPEPYTNTSNYVVLVVILVPLVIIISVTVWYCLKKRKSHSPTSDSESNR
ncbi:SLAM family member 9-like [Centropristis striata]|uniref:SLAM family member 9-like n=1 Tax=Centropristis striata TaxID=184440 RepID=UPI0027E136CE|nr:SLAM family member 9-like [Centropristis striata]